MYENDLYPSGDEAWETDSSSDSEAVDESVDDDFYSFLNKDPFNLDVSEVWRLSRGYSQCHNGIIVQSQIFDSENLCIKFHRSVNIEGFDRLVTIKTCVVQDPTIIFLLFSCVFRGVFETIKTIFQEEAISEVYYPRFRLFFDSDEGRLYIDEAKQKLESVKAWNLFKEHLDYDEKGVYTFVLQ